MYKHWWKAHTKSYAARQLAAYEVSASLGWSFAAWKLSAAREAELSEFQLATLSLRAAAAYGLLPGGGWTGDNDSTAATAPAAAPTPACRHPPAADFGDLTAYGDLTKAPVPAPPPACDGGWWVPEKGECEYWVPPAPCPTLTPCNCSAPGAALLGAAAPRGDGWGGAAAGAAAGFTAAFALLIVGRAVRPSRRRGYSAVPESPMVINYVKPF